MIWILLTLVMFHGPDGQIIWINPEAVTTTRAPKAHEGHFPPGIHCVVNMSDGKFNLVQETCETVKERVGK